MKAHIKWTLKNIFKEIWVRATLYSLLGVVTALLALWLNEYVPESLAGKFGTDSVDKMLNILASSMLAVTTFSLSTMIGAYSSASSGATPRATQLLVQDTTTQNVLSSFVGSFLFSVVGIIALNMGIYGDRGKVVLFIATLSVLCFVVYNLLRWINHLTKFGRLGETTSRVEQVSEKALINHAKQPYLGALPMSEAPPISNNATIIHSSKIGYVQYIDMKTLGQICSDGNKYIYCFVLPGEFIVPNTIVAKTDGLSKEENKWVEDAFALDMQRSYEQDPRFGLCVLSEVASRALSPAVNDPGTAIDVISRGTRLLIKYAKKLEEAESLSEREEHNNVYCKRATVEDFFDDFFTPIARDGAALIEVDITLQKSLRDLAETAPKLYKQVAHHHAQLAFKRAEAVLMIQEDKRRLKRHLQLFKHHSQ
ncbi:MAG: DUF2254 domain-containing protein [Neisseria sp.]